MRNPLLVLLFLVVTTASHAQRTQADIKGLAFMAGTWTVKHKWGAMEEF